MSWILAPLPHRHLDALRRKLRIFVFPDDHHLPARLRQQLLCLKIPFDVDAQLFFPPLNVGMAEAGVFGTPVPEAPTDVDRDLWTDISDVNCSVVAGEDPAVFAIASQSTCTKGSTKRDLWLGVLRLLPAHCVSAIRCGWRWCRLGHTSH